MAKRREGLELALARRLPTRWSANASLPRKRTSLGNGCHVQVRTSAHGSEAPWLALLDPFHQRHPLSGVRITITDRGAHPAVVSLHLEQAVERLPLPGRPG